MTKLTRALGVAVMGACVGLLTFAAENESAAQGTAGSPSATGGRTSGSAGSASSDSDDGGGCTFGGPRDSGTGLLGLALPLGWALARRRSRVVR